MKITLVDYNSNWPNMFGRESDILLNALQIPSVQIEHIGSTSVPGLLAKPIIDIMIGLHDFSIADGLVPKIVKLGYTYFPQFEAVIPDRRFFKKLVNDTATHHIHMTQIDSEFWNRHLLFRNYLRANPNIVGEYAALKTELAKKDWPDSNDFAIAKTDFVRRIESLARLENQARLQ